MTFTASVTVSPDRVFAVWMKSQTQRIADEKDGRIVSRHVPVAFLGLKLNAKARGSRAVSAEPFSNRDRRNLMKVGVFLRQHDSLAVVYLLISALVQTKCPYAPDPSRAQRARILSG